MSPAETRGPAETREPEPAETGEPEPAETREPAGIPAAAGDPAQASAQAQAQAQASAQARAQAQAQDFAELGGLMLARSTVDRVSVRRGDPEWVAAAWADPRTRVVVLDTTGQALVRFGDNQAELVLVPPGNAPDGLSFLLGVDDGGVTYFGVLERPADTPEPSGPDEEPARPEQLAVVVETGCRR